MAESIKNNDAENLWLGDSRDEYWRLGNSGYEQKNVEIKDSTYHARRKFLHLIARLRPHIPARLLRIINTEYLPPDDKELADAVYQFFVLKLFGRNYSNKALSSFEIDPRIGHTPILFFLDYLDKKQDKIALLKNQIETE